MIINTDFKLNNYGFEECKPKKSYGPAIRDHYLFHYVIKGRGTFQIRDHTFDIKKDQMFVICPNDLTFYQADDKDPWVYSWIGFTGMGSLDLIDFLGITNASPVLTVPKGSFIKDILNEFSMISAVDMHDNFYSISLLYRFISELIRIFPGSAKIHSDHYQNSYVYAVENFIRNNYQNDIRITGIAKLIGIDRSYLSSLFKKIKGLSIQEYLIEHRLEKALALVKETDLSILEIARSVGYSEQFIFSKSFKKKYGLSPLKYRKTDPEDHSNSRLKSENSQ